MPEPRLEVDGRGFKSSRVWRKKVKEKKRSWRRRRKLKRGERTKTMMRRRRWTGPGPRRQSENVEAGEPKEAGVSCVVGLQLLVAREYCCWM